jgi:HTH-type transcriptional regulator / antitoxin HigA
MIKEAGKMTAAAKFDAKAYGKLLAKLTPKIIETAEEYNNYLIEAEKLLEMGEKKSAEEKALLQLLVTLIEQYEDKQYQLKRATPQEFLQHLMEARDLKHKDLVTLFNSRGYTSDVINGKRPISADIARRLGSFFDVDPGLFI